MRGGFDFEATLVAAGLGPIAGTDEAGRGACAGPLVAAAVILDPDRPIDGLGDSKTLSPGKRERLYDQITGCAVWAVAEVSAAECDALGMHEADIQGLRRAVSKLSQRPGFVLSDGFAVDGLGVPSLGVWKGDKVAACVSAASIVAKVTRDRLMVELAKRYPNYGFEVHKGYVTKLHSARLAQFGPSVEHRMSYANVRAARAHLSPVELCP